MYIPEPIKFILFAIVIVTLFCTVVYTPGNLDYVKAHGPAYLHKNGWDTVGYEGYQWGLFGFNTYGGAKVWWRLKTIPDNGIVYTGYLQRWGDELHIYGPYAIDAIKPR